MKRLVVGVILMLCVAGLAFASSGGEGGGGHDSQKVISFGWRLLSFVVLAALLYKYTAKGIKGFFAEERQVIVDSLREAEAAREEAKQKLLECNEKMERATSEIGEIANMIRAQGEAEKEKIVEDAKKSADKMKEDAEARIEQEFKKAVSQLRIEAAEMSIQMAEDILRKKITKEDHEIMVKDFLARMVSHN